MRTIEQPGTTVAVTDATFADAVVGGDGPVLAYFWATWCPPCKMIAPVLEELAAELAGRLTIAKIDIDENPATARDCGVMAAPTLQLFRDGEAVQIIVGARSKSALLSWLEPHL
ncbi:thioredoxin [Solihabitans fulvus]|uniref:Thioredoxin n=1 Tax=Solihabitans fulvus TaxID=1892852 RepID=A0A5B2XMR9_9PSEU|nr:thioredoxin [Solihabitans fulvus]KAA2264676.1 thioredoxin [Solihabitans fulvus]